MAKKGISRKNAVFPKLIMRNPTTIKKKGDGKFKKSLNFKDLERLSVAGIPIKLFLLW
jgi:hypothetical protein